MSNLGKPPSITQDTGKVAEGQEKKRKKEKIPINKFLWRVNLICVVLLMQHIQTH